MRKANLLLVLGLGLLVLLASVYWLFAPPRKEKYELSLTAGDALGRRQNIANSLADSARSHGVDLVQEDSTGSVDALHLVESGECDLALVQGGLKDPDLVNVRQVAVLHVEPLHLLVKPTLAGAANADINHSHVTSLAQLGQALQETHTPTINVGSKGSGTNLLASELLAFFGLNAGKDYQVSHFGYEELRSMTSEELPSAVFTVSSLPSPIARHLINEQGFVLVELSVARAFKLDWTKQENSASFSRRKTFEADIPAFVYSVNPPIPDRSLSTIGCRLHLVANSKTDERAIQLVNEAVYGSSWAGTFQPPLDFNDLNASAEFPLHEGAASYLRNKTPLITENVIGLTEQLIAICGAVVGGLVFLWQAALIRKRRRRDRQFLACIERVGEIEQASMRYERDDHMQLSDLLQLHEELNQMKRDMVKQFQSGDIEGAETLSGFLMHVNDAHENVTRLILHEREAQQRAEGH